jgi:hypothetical protein
MATRRWGGQPRSACVNSSRAFSDVLLRGRANTLQAWVIDGATHEYPNGKNHSVILAEHVWEFFASKRLP